MMKCEVFVPFVNARDKMVEYFAAQNVIRLRGSVPITAGVDPEAEFTEFEEQALAFAQDLMVEAGAGGMLIDNEVTFSDEFYVNTEVIGYEFEFYAFEEVVAELDLS